MKSAPESMRRPTLSARALVARPDACPQSVRRGVGDLDGLVVGGERDHCRCRAEGLLGHDGHVEGDVDEHGGRVPGRTSLQPFASGQDLRAGFDRGPDLLREVLREVGAGQRADFRGLVAGIADDQVSDGGGEPVTELVCHRLVHDEPLRAQAGLAGVQEAARDGLGDDDVEVGILEDDERVGAAELEQALLRGPPGAGRDVGAGSVAAGQADGCDRGRPGSGRRRSSGRRARRRRWSGTPRRAGRRRGRPSRWRGRHR